MATPNHELNEGALAVELPSGTELCQAKWCWIAGGALILLALAARLAWIDFDLPAVPDVDAFKFVGEADRMVSTGELRPQDFQYPGGYTNLLALSYRMGD
jgi:hypothetical protein